MNFWWCGFNIQPWQAICIGKKFLVSCNNPMISTTSQLLVVFLSFKAVFCESLVFVLCSKTLSKEIFCKAEGRFN
jgi:hypothetical protein